MFIELEKYVVNTSLIESFNEGGIWFSGAESPAHITESDYNKLRQKLLASPKKRVTSDTNSELEELFIRLHRLTGGKSSAIFNPAREKKLKDLMSKHKMTEDLLIVAATNIGQDPYLQGDNDNKKRYGDIDYLLRPDKAMKWAEANPVSKKRGMFNG